MPTNTDPARAREILAHVIATEEAKGYAGRFGKDQKHVPEWAALEAIAAALGGAEASAPVGVEAVRGAWLAAITLANNICVQESDRENDRDGDTAWIDGTAKCAKRIREYAHPTDAELLEMLDEAGANAAKAALAQQPAAPVLAKHQPCGCVICTCEDERQCQGCGAKHCGNLADHPPFVAQQPAAPNIRKDTAVRNRDDADPAKVDTGCRHNFVRDEDNGGECCQKCGKVRIRQPAAPSGEAVGSDGRRERLLERRTALNNSFGNGAYEDGRVQQQIDAIDAELAALATPQQPAAPSGEAVAWLRMTPDGTPDWAEDCIGSDDKFLDPEMASDGYYLQPLYAAPQQPAPSVPVGVGDEARRLYAMAFNAIAEDGSQEAEEACIRAIEAALAAQQQGGAE